MLGTIIGDIVGSIYEWHNHRSKSFALFHKNCFFTDDSVMTLAVAAALIKEPKPTQSLAKATVEMMQRLGRHYPDRGYGSRFSSWLEEDYPQPYNSYGNGAGMRVSAVAYVAHSIAEVKKLSAVVTGVTHNHPEGMLAAEAIAMCTFLALRGESKATIKAYVQRHYYPLNDTLDAIRPINQFSEKASVATPQAIQAFLEASDFEDAIRNAISIGGDSDTIAAMTGAIAEAYYGIPSSIKAKGLSYLPPTLKKIYTLFTKHYGKKPRGKTAK